MADDASVDLLARWRGGDAQAATLLFRRYAEKLIALAQRQLSARLAQRVAPEDVVQSVYCSFFVGARDGQYVLERSGDLWRLLVGITLHKLQHQFRRHLADRRSIRREEGTNGEELAEFMAQEPSPDQAVALADELEQALRRLEPLARRVFELRLQGYSLDEIAAAVECCERTVRRTLKRVTEQLEQWYRETSAG